MTELIISLVLAFGITYYALPALIHVAQRKKLFDLPDARKVHKQPIPALGGLAIFAGFITSFMVTVSFAGENFQMQYVVAASLVLFFIGLKDDLQNIAALKKFLGQVFAAVLLVYKGGFLIDSMYGIFGIYDLQPVAAQCLSIFTIVVIINAFNLIDGIDGLAGTLCMVSAAFFGTFFFINGDLGFATLAFALMGSLVAFLIFNFPPARMFMGDTGSLVLGLINSVFVIHFIQTAANAPVWRIESAPGIAFAVLFIPLFDTFRVFSYRILTGTPPFTPDRNHIHHLILKLGFNHLQTTLTLVFFNLLVLGMAYLIQFTSSTIILAAVMFTGFSVILLLLYLTQRKQQSLEEASLAKAAVIKPLNKPAGKKTKKPRGKMATG